MRKSFQLDPADVYWTASSGRSGRRAVRLSRAVSVSSFQGVLQHVPTGLCVRASVLPGHYSRGRLRELTVQLWSLALERLTSEVAPFVRVARRPSARPAGPLPPQLRLEVYRLSAGRHRYLIRLWRGRRADLDPITLRGWS
jgi:hypothetical protein